MSSKTAAKVRHSTSSPVNVSPLRVRWSEKRLLAEARKRTKEMFNAKTTQVMLEALLKEAGWTNDEFIDALCQDVISKGHR